MSGRWLIRRIATSIFVLLIALAVNFAIPRLMPGSPVDLLAGGAKLTAEAREALVVRFGLDASLGEQFWRYLVGAARGDLGLSFAYFPRPVRDLVAQALPWTLLVLLSSLVFQVLIGYFAGVASAWNAGGRTDTVLSTLSLVLFSTPLFWLAMVLLYVFGFRLGWLPLGGAYTIGAAHTSTFARVGDIVSHAVLPVVSLTLAQYAAYQLILRNNLIGVRKEQYVLIAEAKGLGEANVKHKHAARNALLPVVTFLGLSFSMSVGGAVFVESVFSYPGIGKLMYDSVVSRDYPTLQGCFLVFALVVVAGNFLVDVAYRFLDPRIRYAS